MKTDKRKKFYKKSIKNLIIDKNSKILIVGATINDKEIFLEEKFSNVFICNLESNNHFKYSPYKHIKSNMNKIELVDESFDFVVAHACIHHSSKPHSALLEMYRVAKKGIIIIEGNDSIFMRIASKFGYAQEYEHSALIGKKSYDKGGVDNTNVPNYVFRWSEREIYKLLKSFKPHLRHNIEFFYDYDFEAYKKVKKIKYFYPLIIFIEICIKILFKIFRNQSNLMCIYINKEKKIYQEWI